MNKNILIFLNIHEQLLKKKKLKLNEHQSQRRTNYGG